MASIYGEYENNLYRIMDGILGSLNKFAEREAERTGRALFDHINHRVKSDESMRGKLELRGLDPTPVNAIHEMKDAIGLRIVCLFVDEVYETVKKLKEMENVTVIQEKDYITNSKPNGYRSYHMILEITTEFPDPAGNNPGIYYAEVQLRTIAMDTWAQLEHEINYKQDISNRELLAKELKRCADDLAGCDISMQTLRNIAKQGI